MAGFVKIDDSELRKLLRDAPRQIPFAMSKALNNLALATRAELKWHMKQDGITLRTGWPISGIRVLNRATRTNLRVDVGSVDPMMQALAEGGDRPFRGLVPVIGPGGGRETFQGVMRSDLRKNQALGVEALLTQKTTIGTRTKMRFVRRANTIYDLQAGGFKIHKREKGKLIVLPGTPVLRIPKASAVNIPRRWKYQERVAFSTAKNWERSVLEAVNYALSTRTVGH